MKPNKRKEQILNSAKKLFSKNGYYETQISDIIKDADIARGTLYQYFDSKDDIFTTIHENFFEEWLQATTQKIENAYEMKPRNFFFNKVKTGFQYFADNPEIANIILRRAIGLPENLELGIRRLENLIVDETTKELNLAKKRGVLKENINIELTSIMAAGAFIGTAYHYFVTVKDDSNNIDVDQLTRDFANNYVDGIKHPDAHKMF